MKDGVGTVLLQAFGAEGVRGVKSKDGPGDTAFVADVRVARPADLVYASAFARFDGRLNFRVIAYAPFDGGRQTATSDRMPNLPAQFTAVR